MQQIAYQLDSDFASRDTGAADLHAADSQHEKLTLRADDGRELAAEISHTVSAPKVVLVISGAMGVPMRFYKAFAQYLVDAGITVLRFDYRGIGASQRTHSRAESASLADWGRLDARAAYQAAFARWPQLPVVALTHSIGGQLLGLAGVGERLSGVVFVASQMGYWRYWRGAARLLMLATWRAVIPALSKILGYLPMRALGQGEDLPRAVARDWARWGTQKRSLLDDVTAHPSGFADLSAPVLALSFADDQYAPHNAVKALLAELHLAPTEHWHQNADSVRRRPVGHFGFFKPTTAPDLWADLVRWLAELKPVADIKAEQAKADAAHRAWLYR